MLHRKRNNNKLDFIVKTSKQLFVCLFVLFWHTKNERYILLGAYFNTHKDFCPDNELFTAIQRDKSQKKYIRDQSIICKSVCM